MSIMFCQCPKDCTVNRLQHKSHCCSSVLRITFCVSSVVGICTTCIMPNVAELCSTHSCCAWPLQGQKNWCHGSPNQLEMTNAQWQRKWCATTIHGEGGAVGRGSLLLKSLDVSVMLMKKRWHWMHDKHLRQRSQRPLSVNKCMNTTNLSQINRPMFFWQLSTIDTAQVDHHHETNVQIKMIACSCDEGSGHHHGRTFMLSFSVHRLVAPEHGRAWSCDLFWLVKSAFGDDWLDQHKANMWFLDTENVCKRHTRNSLSMQCASSFLWDNNKKRIVVDFLESKNDCEAETNELFCDQVFHLF